MKSDAWGRQVLEGANLDLVVVFVVAGLVLIILHAAAAAWLRHKRSSGRLDE